MVVAHCLVRGSQGFRATHDADAMVPPDYSNAAFASDYLWVYAADPRYSKAIYEAVFGIDGFERLGDAENKFVNVSFVGADEDLDGIDTPDFDICRTLNGRMLSSIKRERLEVLGQGLWVATVDELLAMKRETIAIYGNDIRTNPRPQDFVDVSILSSLEGDSSADPGDGDASDGFLLRLRKALGGSR